MSRGASEEGVFLYGGVGWCMMVYANNDGSPQIANGQESPAHLVALTEPLHGRE